MCFTRQAIIFLYHSLFSIFVFLLKGNAKIMDFMITAFS